MKTNIKKSLAITALALSGSLFAAQSFGAVLNLSGSSSIGSSGATIGLGLDLNAPGLITVVNPIFGINTGDYAPLLLNAPFTFSATALDLSNMSTFNINGPASSGTYVVSQLIIKAQDANFLDVYTRGLFTPGSLLGTQSGGCATGGNTCAVSDTSLRWSFTKSGDSVSASGSLSSPAVTLNVPEPASLSLLIIGLIGGAANLRKSTKKLAS